MNKIDLNKNMIDLDGNQIDGGNIGKIVAQFLIAENEGNALKMWDWSQKLYRGECLELDFSDYTDFKQLIQNTKKLPVITKAQILQIITQ